MQDYIFKLSAISLLVALPATLSAQQNQTVLDKQHANVQSTLHSWSNAIDDWFGEPDPNSPASANLRIMLDNQWNRYDGYSVKPRVRAKIRLPTLKKCFSIMIGDEDLDNHAQDKNQTTPNYREPLEKDKRYDRRQAKNDNSSIALRWSDAFKGLGIDSDFDIGIRSGADIFARLKVSKEWKHNDIYSTRLEQIYRYGFNSKHYLRTNFENKLTQDKNTFVNNHTYLDYKNNLDEIVTWGNSLYREHNFAGYKRLNYGITVGGYIEHKKAILNQYGPFITWRQPILRKWFFIQPEVHFYNNKKLERKHTLGAFLRLEAIF
ncbi:hypothetical protein ACWIVU_06815 [Ursidibacter arcticus]